VNKSKSGKISSLPKSIAKERTAVAISEYISKLAIGPTFARPGPILLKQAETAVKFVSRSKGSSEITRNIARKMIK
jgi:hypothetical protein